MSEITTHTIIPIKKRYRIIKEYIAEEKISKIAERCHCEERTIYRDISKMKLSGEWWEWLERAMFRYGQKKDVSNETRFREYVKLYSKQFIKEKREDTVTGDITLKWMKNDDSSADDSL